MPLSTITGPTGALQVRLIADFNPSSPVPVYFQVAEQFSRLVNDGAYAAGTALFLSSTMGNARLCVLYADHLPIVARVNQSSMTLPPQFQTRNNTKIVR